MGGIYRVGLADGVITHSFPSQSNIDSMKLNCNNKRLGVIYLNDSELLVWDGSFI